MRLFVPSRWFLVAGALVPAILVFTPFTPRTDARGDDRPVAPAPTEARSVSYLREVRPILAQHCFQCHGPDEAARKAKLRLDLKGEAFAPRTGGRAVAPANLDHSLVWERITAEDADERMPPAGDVPPLTPEKIATIK